MGDAKASTLPAFNPPGFPSQDDGLNAQQRASWSDTISEWMTNEISGQYRDESGSLQPLEGPCGTNRTKLPQFFNGTATPFNTAQKPTLISWIGFPNLVANSSSGDVDRWSKADARRDQQDEYCEWTVKRDSHKRITSVTFTCEGPEYWSFLSQHDPQKMLDLYKKNNPEYASQMKAEDMFETVHGKRVYNPYNKWNGVVKTKPPKDDKLTTVNPGCIMHLAQRNNTLSAEIDIAAQGTVIRKDGQGNVITDAVKLCNCSAYGQATRNSDPQIGASINGLARGGNAVSIADPVGIYMVGFDQDSFMLDPDGTGENLIPPPSGTFTWARGDIGKQKGLRLHIQVPDGCKGTGDLQNRQLTVSDLVDTNNNGLNVKYGAQFADYIHMGVHGVVVTGVPVAAAQPCPCDGTLEEADGKEQSQWFTLMATVDGAGQRIPFKTRA